MTAGRAAGAAHLLRVAAAAGAAIDGRIYRAGALAVGKALVAGTAHRRQLRDGHLAALRVVVSLSAGMNSVGTLVGVLERINKLFQMSVAIGGGGWMRRTRRTVLLLGRLALLAFVAG